MKRTRVIPCVTLGITLTLVATPVWAEAMDKEPSVGAVWGIGLLSGCIGVLAVHYYPWFGIGTLLLAIIAFGGIFS